MSNKSICKEIKIKFEKYLIYSFTKIKIIALIT